MSTDFSNTDVPSVFERAQQRLRAVADTREQVKEIEAVKDLVEAATADLVSANERLNQEIETIRANQERRRTALLDGQPTLKAVVIEREREVILTALKDAGGSVTKAARMVGTSYQGLAYIIGSRHKDLLSERSPVHKRTRRKDDSA